MTRYLRLFLLLSLTAMPALAQDEPAAPLPPPAAPAVEPMLLHVPSDAMGYVVLHGVGRTMGQVDTFLQEIGVEQMLPQAPGGMLEVLQGALQLGDGFDPNGDMGIVMLNPKPFGVDFAKLITRLQQGEPPGEDDKLPFVAFIPGVGVESILAAYQPTRQGDFYVVTLPKGPMQAAQCGNYVILSPRPDALKAVLAVDAKARPAATPPDHAKAIAAANIAAHVNMTVSAPVLVDLLDVLEKEMTREATGQEAVVKKLLGLYRKLLPQIRAVTFTGRLVNDGVLIDELIDMDPDSVLGKLMAAQKAPGQLQLNRVPNFSYVLAAAFDTGVTADGVKAGIDMARELISGVRDEQWDRIESVALQLNDQVEQVQMVAGGSAGDSGVFGVSVVLRCKDAEKTKALLAETVETLSATVKSVLSDLGPNDKEDIDRLTVRYLKGLENVGGVPADAIVFEHPSLQNLSEQEQGLMKLLLGEDQIRLLIAAADARTVVVTFGGSTEFLGAALQAAKGDQVDLLASEDVQQALKHLPMPANGVVLLNFSNIFQLLKAGLSRFDPDLGEALPFQFTSQVPIAGAFQVRGAGYHATVFVPNATIKDIVQNFVTLTQPAVEPEGGQTPPAQGAEDF